MKEPWLEWRSSAQNDLIQPACRDLSEQLVWDHQGYAVRLSQDEWRWLGCADILGQKPVRGISGGIVLLGGSSRKLTKEQATDLITLLFSIGDAPWDYDLEGQKRVEWSTTIKLARGISDDDEQLAEIYGHSPKK